MLRFQPPGFGQQVIPTRLGVMAYYTPVTAPWKPIATAPPLVFLHSLGGGSSAYEWSKVYPAFAATHRVIAPDLIGWGQSTHPARDYRVEDYLDMLTDLLRWIDQPVTIVAASLTAGISIRLAIQHPEFVQQLFLVAPAGYADFGADYGRNLTARIAGIPTVDRLIYQFGAANEWAIQAFMSQFLFADPARITPEMIAAYLASAQQSNAEYAALASLRGDLCFDLSLYLPQLQTPARFAWGAKARFSDAAIGQRLASLNPQQISLLPLIPDAGVLAHLEQPAAVIAQLWQALDSGNQ